MEKNLDTVILRLIGLLHKSTPDMDEVAIFWRRHSSLAP